MKKDFQKLLQEQKFDKDNNIGRQMNSSEEIEMSNLKLKEILCIKGNSSLLACMEKECQKYSFLCGDKMCECQKDHQECLTSDIKKVVNKILSKIGSTKQLEDHICKTIDRQIDELSDLRDKLIIQISQKFKYFSLSKQQKAFLKSIETNNLDQITSKQISGIINEFINSQNKLKITEQIKYFQMKIDEIWKQHQLAIKNAQNLMFKQLKYIKQGINNKLFKGSKIAKTNEHINNLIEFFGNKKIKASKFLYRASQNDFLASKFHQKCDNIPHTLTLCETEFGKIIGGYTPIIWNKVNGNYTTDPQRRSFLFSLTNNQKLKIHPTANQGNQIYCQSNGYGPTFGGSHDLRIYDKANQNTHSYSRIGYTYVHNNYIYENQQSWKRFSGATSGYNFKIKQWQVWSIQFYQ